MPLTPQDVRNKLFTSVRLRPGYDEDEVDSFLDEVEHELGRLLAEIESLKGGARPAPAPSAVPEQPPAPVPTAVPVVDGGDADARVRAALADVGHRHAQELSSVRAEQDAAVAAARAEAEQRLQDQVQAASHQAETVRAQAETLRRQAEARVAQATQQAQQLQAQHEQQVQVLQQRAAQAQAQAEQAQRQAAAAGQELARVRSDPAAGQPGGLAPAYGPGSALPPPSPTEEALRRTLLLAQRTADEAINEARAEAQRIVGDAQRHAADTTRRAEAEHGASMRRAQTEYEALATKLEELRGFERDYRSRLRAYLHLQLRDLEAGAPEPPPAVTAPTRSALPESTVAPPAAPAAPPVAPPVAPAAAPPVAPAAAPPVAPPPMQAPDVPHSAEDVSMRPPPLYGDRPPGGADR